MYIPRTQYKKHLITADRVTLLAENNEIRATLIDNESTETRKQFVILTPQCSAIGNLPHSFNHGGVIGH